MNENIYDMLVTLINTSGKQNNQEEKAIDISCKLSTYEDRLEKMSNNKT